MSIYGIHRHRLTAVGPWWERRIIDETTKCERSAWIGSITDSVSKKEAVLVAQCSTPLTFGLGWIRDTKWLLSSRWSNFKSCWKNEVSSPYSSACPKHSGTCVRLNVRRHSLQALLLHSRIGSFKLSSRFKPAYKSYLLFCKASRSVRNRSHIGQSGVVAISLRRSIFTYGSTYHCRMI